MVQADDYQKSNNLSQPKKRDPTTAKRQQTMTQVPKIGGPN